MGAFRGYLKINQYIEFLRTGMAPEDFFSIDVVFFCLSLPFKMSV
jgi:hypothetical protein